MTNPALPAKKQQYWPHFRRYRIAYLTYLGFYPLPWILNKYVPTLPAILFSIAAVLTFLLLYFAPYRKDHSYGLTEICLITALGFSTTWTHASWPTFLIYATGMCGRLENQRLALYTVILIQISVLLFDLLFHESLTDAALTILLGVMTYFGTSMQWRLGIQNLKLQAAQHEIRNLAETAERERIARDMHDLLGHSLTVISVKAELANRLLSSNPQRAATEIRDITHIARTSLKDVRDAVTGMNGASLQHELDRARKALNAADISLTLHAQTPPKDHQKGSVLAMALREAITNVIRHSGAHHCTIQLACDGNGHPLSIAIEDDGPKHRQSVSPLQEGNGLRGMKSRLAAAGGSLTLSHTPQTLRLTASLTP